MNITSVDVKIKFSHTQHFQNTVREKDYFFLVSSYSATICWCDSVWYSLFVSLLVVALWYLICFTFTFAVFCFYIYIVLLTIWFWDWLAVFSWRFWSLLWIALFPWWFFSCFLCWIFLLVCYFQLINHFQSTKRWYHLKNMIYHYHPFGILSHSDYRNQLSVI